MLTYLQINHFTIIDHLELDFAPGMTVITGETGAGKSIMIDALNLLLGMRADQRFVRSGCERAEIHAAFELAHLPQAKKWLIEHDINADECLLRRTITSDGRSKHYINGQPVTLQNLRELGGYLIQIHGQHQHQQLLQRDLMRTMLDNYGDLNALADEVNLHYRAWKTDTLELEKLLNHQDGFEAQVALLRYQVQELKELDLANNELEQLHAEHKLKANADNLQSTGKTLLDVLEDDAKFTVLNALQRALQQIQIIDTPKLASAKTLLDNANIQIEEATQDIRHFVGELEFDPERMQHVEQRLAMIHDMARKHQVNAEQLGDHFQRLQNELANLENSEENIVRLRQSIATHSQAYFGIAKKLTAARKKTAKQLAKAMCARIQQLGMPQGQFDIQFETVTAETPTLNGCERVSFCVSLNPGTPMQALNKVASGGELSRISLALQVLTASSCNSENKESKKSKENKKPSMIFDEVDTGISGNTAHIVGEQLRLLAEKNGIQVLCVTHLPQVAAFGEQHLQVTKHIDNDATYTTTTSLAGDDRLKELARMLGGKSINQQSLANAKALLEEAN